MISLILTFLDNYACFQHSVFCSEKVRSAAFQWICPRYLILTGNIFNLNSKSTKIAKTGHFEIRYLEIRWLWNIFVFTIEFSVLELVKNNYQICGSKNGLPICRPVFSFQTAPPQTCAPLCCMAAIKGHLPSSLMSPPMMRWSSSAKSPKQGPTTRAQMRRNDETKIGWQCILQGK